MPFFNDINKEIEMLGHEHAVTPPDSRKAHLLSMVILLQQHGQAIQKRISADQGVRQSPSPPGPAQHRKPLQCGQLPP